MATVRNRWFLTVNNHVAFGLWPIIDVTAPWGDAMHTIRGILDQHSQPTPQEAA